MGAVFGDLQWLRFGPLEDLPADRCTVAVGPSAYRHTRRRRTDRDLRHIRGRDRHQGRSRVNWLAAARSCGRSALAPDTLRCCGLFVQVGAGRRLVAGGAVEHRTAFERSDAIPQGRGLPLGHAIILLKRRSRLDERRDQAQQLPAPVLENCECLGWERPQASEGLDKRRRDPPSSPLRRLGLDSHHGGQHRKAFARQQRRRAPPRSGAKVNHTTVLRTMPCVTTCISSRYQPASVVSYS